MERGVVPIRIAAIELLITDFQSAESMSTMQATPRSPRLDLPPAPVYSTLSPTDNGLAEWTSKIKAMQRQVDADDEAEQRRLEEEIVRARLARMRRSRTGTSGDFGIDLGLCHLVQCTPHYSLTCCLLHRQFTGVIDFHSCGKRYCTFRREAVSGSTLTQTSCIIQWYIYETHHVVGGIHGRVERCWSSTEAS